MGSDFRKITANAIVSCIHLMKTVFMMPAGSCRFSPSCTSYTREAFITYPLHIATLLVTRRLFRCHPFANGGYDPVPAKKNNRCHERLSQ